MFMWQSSVIHLAVVAFATCLLTLSGLVQAQEPVTLTFLTDLPGTDQVIAAFNEIHPEIQIQLEQVSFREIYPTLQVRLGAGSNNPDIVETDPSLVASYVNRGWIRSLEGSFDQTTIDNWVDALYQSSLYNGELYAPPFGTRPRSCTSILICSSRRE